MEMAIIHEPAISERVLTPSQTAQLARKWLHDIDEITRRNEEKHSLDKGNEERLQKIDRDENVEEIADTTENTVIILLNEESCYSYVKIV